MRREALAAAAPEVEVGDLIASDSGGEPGLGGAVCMHEFVTWIVSQRLSYSVGFPLPVLLAGGADLHTVKERLGHGRIVTTGKYRHTLAETDDTALTALGTIRARHRSN